MSNKELDSLFKNKLEQLTQEPSSNAWEQIRAKTEQKKHTSFYWMRIAAAILLLVTSGIVVWQFTKDQIAEQPISENSNIPETSPAADRANAIPAEPESDKSITEDTPQKSVPPAKDNLKAQNKPATDQTSLEANDEEEKKEKVNSDQQKEAVEKMPAVEKVDLQANIAQQHTPDATIATQPASTNQESQKSNQGVTLEFDLSDFAKTAVAVNEKQGNIEKENTKGLNKVLNLMKELKEEANIGDLREAKNEIFAFNFKKENKDDSE